MHCDVLRLPKAHLPEAIPNSMNYCTFARCLNQECLVPGGNKFLTEEFKVCGPSVRHLLLVILLIFDFELATGFLNFFDGWLD